jgi:hypothetical protein
LFIWGNAQIPSLVIDDWKLNGAQITRQSVEWSTSNDHYFMKCQWIWMERPDESNCQESMTMKSAKWFTRSSLFQTFGGSDSDW